jgi:5-methylcytosine-specific restriction protein A
VPNPPRTARGGWVPPKNLPKGPDGRALCRRCSTEVPIGRRTFCSEPCVHEWKVRTQPEYAARQVEARDKGICAECQLDTAALRSMFRLLPHGYANRLAWLEQQGLPKELLTRRRWFDVDHIVPVIEGGGSCGLEGLRTLCLPCHKVATAKLAARRAEARRAG